MATELIISVDGKEAEEFDDDEAEPGTIYVSQGQYDKAYSRFNKIKKILKKQKIKILEKREASIITDDFIDEDIYMDYGAFVIKVQFKVGDGKTIDMLKKIKWLSMEDI